jgi:hypothetical protein
MAAALLGDEQSGHLTLHPVSRLWRAAWKVRNSNF